MRPFSPQNVRQLHASRLARILNVLKYAIPALMLLLVASAFHLWGSPRIPKFQYGEQLEPIGTLEEKTTFVNQFLSSEIDGPFNNTPIVELCKKKEWIDGLVIKCDPGNGGVGNIRNIFLNCIRYAIELGATKLVLPEIIQRSEDKIDLMSGKHLPFTYLFDTEYAIQTLEEACPRMQVRVNENEFDNITREPVGLIPRQLVGAVRDFFPICVDPVNLVPQFHDWQERFHPNMTFTPQDPQIIVLEVHFFEWPLAFDTPEFVVSFGRVVRFRPDVRQIAGAVLYGVSKYTSGLNPTYDGIQDGTFYGAHLRTSADAAAVNWRPYEQQSPDYIKGAFQNHLTLTYLASGNPPDIKRFISDAAEYDISVVTKDSILALPDFAAEREMMKKLSWDQMGLIDYDVLLRSSHFGATFETSFGWNIAFRRHVVVSGGVWQTVTPNDVPENAGVTFEDERSKLYGPKWGMNFFEATLWP